MPLRRRNTRISISGPSISNLPTFRPASQTNSNTVIQTRRSVLVRLHESLVTEMRDDENDLVVEVDSRYLPLEDLQDNSRSGANSSVTMI
ncbi:hypothetical protein Clacol_000067 [Clathrus columnatus]|uniref:Uncharacterized protein n=1 Tax=Clathrus columnatus TaxID=1419009 RepID=A0AAV4ZWK2_9AGAM|nr:hypothetical protein Clacol_000067 [Clathrus columnatus]